MRNNLFALGLFTLWLVSYIIYPLWYFPQEELRGIAFGALLIFFIANFLLIDRFVSSLKPDEGNTTPPAPKGGKIIWWSGIIYFLLQVYPLTMPVLSRSDEEHHLTSSLVYYLKFTSFWERCLRVSWTWGAWFLIFLSFFLFKRKFRLDLLRGRKFLVIFLLSSGAIIYYFIFTRYYSLESFFYLFHYPWFSKFLYMAGYSLLGVREFGPRLVQAIFGFLSAVYLYKFVSIYRARNTAVFSFILWLFMPACLFFGNLALLTNGVSFFFISSFYYLLRYHQDKISRNLFLGSFILSLGTMYQQPLILALFIYYLYLLALIIRKRIFLSRDKAILILPGWAVLATALPYLILTHFIYVPFAYPSSLAALFSKAAYVDQIKLAFSGLSLVHILFLAIGIITTIRRRDAFAAFLFIWIISYFLFQNIYTTVGFFRRVIPYFPVLTIWMAEGIRRIVKKKMLGEVTILILAYAILTSTVWIVPPLSPRYILYHNIHSRYVPYHEAIVYLKNKLGKDERCLSPGFASPEKFYSLKFGLSPLHLDQTRWERVELQTVDNLYKYATSHRVKFCLFPSGDWPKGFLNPGLRDNLITGEDKRFIVEKIFLSGPNKLYLLKVK